jgi:diguanylate cyclase (GGDEF)-like protein/PAS domain S-box-containing protein
MQLAHDKQRKHFEFRHRCADGSIREVEVFSGPVQIDGKKLIYSIVHDISQRKRAEAQLRESEVLRSNEQATTLEVRGKAQLAALNLAEDAIGARRQAEAAFAALRESEQRHRLLADNATDVIWTMDLEGRFTYVSPSVIKLRGYTPAEMMQQSPTQIFCAESARIATEARRRSLASMAAGLPFDGFRGDLEQMCKDGSTVWTEVATSGMQDEKGEFVGILGVTRNISAQKEQQRQLQHLAHFDALTNLPNRLLLADRLQQGLTQAERRAQTLAVAYIDLDGFKAINDHHGHAIGDQVLIALASSMKKALREGDTFARLGGDEFVAVLIDLEDMSASLALLKRLLTAAAEPVRVGELILQVSASLGVTFYPQAQNIDSDQLLRQADQAMYQAKLAGKNRYHVFDAELDSSMRMHHESVEHIRMALERREFVLHYQPKVNLCSGQVIGAEALIRWQHPQQGLLSPGHFLPVIEDHPLAVAIGAWVIDTALTQLKIWHGAGLNLVVSVNVGARQLQRPDFIDQLRTTLAAHSGVNPSFLELEILETSALEDIERVSQVIEDCAALGVGCALDDFGTGYSSLTYLKRLRVGMLKIDKSFVRDMLDDPDDLAILQGVIGLAGAFRVDVIAEGVETLAHARLLLQLGCELAQGDGIARAMPAHQLPAWAAAWPGEPFWSELVADSQARSPVSLLRS